MIERDSFGSLFPTPILRAKPPRTPLVRDKPAHIFVKSGGGQHTADTTNVAMEISAARDALRQAPAKKQIVLFIDYLQVVNGINFDLDSWTDSGDIP